jgi:hypothetical protein
MLKPELLSVVALLEDIPSAKLRRGQVGTIVEHLGPGVFEVEFIDDNGETYATASVEDRQLLLLLHEPTAA